MTSRRRVCEALSFAVVAIFCSAMLQLTQAAEIRQIKVPHNAFAKFARDDLLTPLRRQGEVRVIVGMQTPQEVAQPADLDADQIKEQRVLARQSRVLQRLAGHNLRNLKRLRHHQFMVATVDAAALNALLADPEVTSVTEDRPVYPVLHQTPGLIRADKAWAGGYRGAGQTVAVIDSGVDKPHPFFSGKVVSEACFSHPMELIPRTVPPALSRASPPAAVHLARTWIWRAGTGHTSPASLQDTTGFSAASRAESHLTRAL